jgi:hypothetical protein
MPAIITTAMRVASAQNLMEYCQDPSNNLYTYISRTLPWAIEASPPTPIDCRKEMAQTLTEMIAAKKVSANDLSLVTPRYNWASGTVYTQYSDSINIFDPLLQPFYAVTSSLNVYKCMNNGGNARSTVQPVGTGTNVISFSDGYLWKYMFTVNSGDALKFITNDWLPVKTLTSNDGSNQWLVQQAAVGGTIDRIDVILGGSQYTTVPTVTITGDGTGATAAAIVNSGIVTSIIVTNRGFGYTYADVSLTGGGTNATGALAAAIISPASGHGADPVSELGAYTTMLSATWTTSESGRFTISNDYRRIGVIQGPLLSDNFTPASDLDYDLSTVLTLSGITGSFVADERVRGTTSNANGYVLDYSSATNTLRVVQSTGTYFPGETITGLTSSASALLQTFSGTATGGSQTTITLPVSASIVDGAYAGQTLLITSGPGAGQSRTIIAYAGPSRTVTVDNSNVFNPVPTSASTVVIASVAAPQLSLTSGTILYLENRTPIMRASDQTEQIRFLISQ